MHARLVAQRFHLRPDLPAGDAFFVSGEKNLAGSDFLFPGVFEELAAELARQQDGPDLAFKEISALPRYTASTVT